MSSNSITQDLPSIVSSGVSANIAPSNQTEIPHTLEDPAKQALSEKIAFVSEECQRWLTKYREERQFGAKYGMALNNMTLDFLKELKDDITCENPDDASDLIKESWASYLQGRRYKNDWPTMNQWRNKRRNDINESTGRKDDYEAQIVGVLDLIEIHLKDGHSSRSHTRHKPGEPYNSECLMNRTWDHAWVRSAEDRSYDAGNRSTYDSLVNEFEHELSAGAAESDSQIPDQTSDIVSWWSKLNPFSRSSQRTAQKERKWCCI